MTSKLTKNTPNLLDKPHIRGGPLHPLQNFEFAFANFYLGKSSLNPNYKSMSSHPVYQMLA